MKRFEAPTEPTGETSQTLMRNGGGALRACQYEIFRLRTVFLAFENIDFADFPMFSY